MRVPYSQNASMHPDPRARHAAAAIAAARRTGDIHPFRVMEVLARAQALEASGRRVIHMEIGEPDFTAAPPVVEATARALRSGKTAYTDSLGLPALRSAIAQHYATGFGCEVPASRIAVTSGASGALLLALALYVEPGREFLVPDPGYPGYRHFVRLFEGMPRSLPVSPAQSFQPTARNVEQAWTPATAGLILGTPSNPSGTTVAQEELVRIAQVVRARGGVLFVDEIYQNLVYGRNPTTAFGLPGEVVLVNSFSKYFCMTGWRLGWAVLPESKVRLFERLAQHLYICPPTLSQHGALAAFEAATLKIFEQRRQEYEKRRDYLVRALKRTGLRIPAEPTGAFYIYADCSAFADDSRRFALELLEREAVALTPGLDFGSNGTSNYVRLAYTQPLEVLEQGVERLTRFCGRG